MEAFFSSRGIEPKVELTAFAPLPLLETLVLIKPGPGLVPSP